MDANTKAKLESRTFLTWDETADYLAFDGEGLRQAMLTKFDVRNGDSWLPVGVDSRGEDFLTHLDCLKGQHVVEKCLNFDGDGMEQDATLSDGSTFAIEGKTPTASWESTHDHRSGWSMCFLLGGRLILDPRSVRYACENGGELRGTSISLTPREWCVPDWSAAKFCFRVIGGEYASAFRHPPENLYRDCFFYANDVFRIAGSAARSEEVRQQRGPWPWGDHETELLRHLAAAAKEFWRTYDPDDQSTAPKNADVVTWLVSHGVARRTAEIIATLLRPENIRTGPR